MATRVNVTTGATASGPTVTLCGGFSPISGMEFLGQSEAKGEDLYKCKRLFNVREINSQNPLLAPAWFLWKTVKLYASWSITICRVFATNGRTILPSRSNPPSLGDGGVGPIIVVIVTAGSVIGRIHLKGISPLVSVPHLLRNFCTWPRC